MRKLVVIALVALSTLGIEAQSAVGTIKVAWDAVADATGSTIAGYKVCVGTTATAFPGCDSVGKVTNTVISGLTDCTTYYVAVKAIDTDGDESANWSNVVSGWPAPRITSAAPASLTTGRPQNVVFTGANFGSDSSVQVTNATVGLVVVSSCTSLSVMITPTISGSPVVTVRSGGIVGTASGTFQVTDAIRPNGVSGVRRAET